MVRRRLRAAIAFACAVVASWYAMQVVHELGHVLAAWLTGGTVQRVVLHPLEISRTDVAPNPRPLFVAWAGPLVGVALPLIAAALARAAFPSWRRYVDFFAGFCLIANGAYIGVGSIEGVGDAGDMLRHGSPPWLLAMFGILCIAGGLWIWHGLTKRGVDPSKA